MQTLSTMRNTLNKSLRIMMYSATLRGTLSHSQLDQQGAPTGISLGHRLRCSQRSNPMSLSEQTVKLRMFSRRRRLGITTNVTSDAVRDAHATHNTIENPIDAAIRDVYARLDELTAHHNQLKGVVEPNSDTITTVDTCDTEQWVPSCDNDRPRDNNHDAKAERQEVRKAQRREKAQDAKAEQKAQRAREKAAERQEEKAERVAERQDARARKKAADNDKLMTDEEEQAEQITQGDNVNQEQLEEPAQQTAEIEQYQECVTEDQISEIKDWEAFRETCSDNDAVGWENTNSNSFTDGQELIGDDIVINLDIVDVPRLEVLGDINMANMDDIFGDLHNNFDLEMPTNTVAETLDQINNFGEGVADAITTLPDFLAQ
jgi:flagellar biosynthesis GTPase FlhF